MSIYSAVAIGLASLALVLSALAALGAARAAKKADEDMDRWAAEGLAGLHEKDDRPAPLSEAEVIELRLRR